MKKKLSRGEGIGSLFMVIVGVVVFLYLIKIFSGTSNIVNTIFGFGE